MFLFFLSAVDPATAGLKRGRKRRERAFLSYPRFRSLYRRKGEKMCPSLSISKRPRSADSSSKKTPSTFHLHTQGNAFRRRDASRQSRFFAPRNQRLRAQTKSQQRLLKLQAITVTRSISRSSPTDVFQSSNKYLRHASVPISPASASVPEPSRCLRRERHCLSH